MKRGEIWTLAGGGDYVGKPRPVVVVQDDRFELASATICPFTTNPREASLFRVGIQPAPYNGLESQSFIMADKVTTVRQSRLGSRIGRITEAETAALDRALIVFLGLTTEAGILPPESESPSS